MTVEVLLPLGAAVFVSVLATTAHRRLPPSLAARVLTALISTLSAVAMPSAALVGLAYVAAAFSWHLPLAWCVTASHVHVHVPAWFGAPMLALSLYVLGRWTRAVRTHRRIRDAGPGGVRVVQHQRPFAVSLPGPAGQIVLSDSLVQLLSPQERAVVLAHEGAHARHRHDRYLLIAQLADALPPLRPLASRLRFAIERWADEAAAAACGDRALVARTLGKVALHPHVGVPGLAFGSSSVVARVAALLQAPATSVRHLRTIWFLTMAAVFALVVYQLHHLWELLAALCA